MVSGPESFEILEILCILIILYYINFCAKIWNLLVIKPLIIFIQVSNYEEQCFCTVKYYKLINTTWPIFKLCTCGLVYQRTSYFGNNRYKYLGRYLFILVFAQSSKFDIINLNFKCLLRFYDDSVCYMLFYSFLFLMHFYKKNNILHSFDRFEVK